MRPALRADLAAVLALWQASDEAILGEVDTDENDVLEDWDDPRVDLARDVVVVDSAAGGIVGYGSVVRRHTGHAELAVVTDPSRQDLAGPLLAALIERAGGEPLEVWVSPADLALVAAVRDAGFRAERSFLRMTRALDGPVEAPTWPTGVTARAYVPGADGAALYGTITGAFATHWRGSTPEPQDEWIARTTAHPAFDPALVTLAEQDGATVGAVLAFDFDGLGWVRNLGVMPSHRGRGLGTALLVHTFGLLQHRGILRVDLGVDAANADGAIGLYEAAGMRQARSTDFWVR